MPERSARPWLRRAAALALAAVAAGCATKDGSPTAPQQANLAVQAQVSGADGASLRVQISYQRASQAAGGSLETVTLFDRTMPFATGTTTMPVVIDISGCIADKRRVPLTPGCDVAVDLSLVSGTTVLDEQVLDGIGLAPGQTTQLPNVLLTPVHSVVVAPALDTILVGQTLQLSDTVKDVTGQALTGRAVSWSTSNAAVATVSASGLVTGVAASANPVTITATAVTHSGSASIVVEPPPTMKLSADTIRFGATRNSAIPPSQSVTVMNSGGGTLQGLSVAPVAYHGTSSGWLQATLVDSTVTLSILTTNLPASTDTALVIISSTNASNSPVAILVLYQIGQGAVPQLTPGTLTFNVSLGTAPASQSTTVSNAGSGSLGTISIGTVQYGVGAPVGWGTPPTGWLNATVSGTTVTVAITNTAVPLGGQFTSAIVPVKSSGGADSVNLVVQLNVTTKFTQVAVGRDHACALAGTGAAYCWGDNSRSQIGDGTSATAWPVPVPVAGGHSFTSLTAGYQYTCGVLADGVTVDCWGANESGQLGDGTTTDRNTPVQAQTPTSLGNVTALAAGGASTCATVGANYSTYCWGANDKLEVDANAASPQTTPYAIAMPTGAVFPRLSAGRSHMCATDYGGHEWCWGNDTYLQLARAGALNAVGLGDTSRVTLDTTVVAAFAGPTSNTSCVVMDASTTVQCWGDNTSGELGIGTQGGTSATPSTVATAVGALLSGVTSVSTGTFHACAVTNTGSAYCWGDNTSGELGTGGGNSLFAAPVTGGPSGFSSVYASYYWTCGMGTDGRVYCWGGNTFGRLGLGSTSSSTTPVVVKGQQ